MSFLQSPWLLQVLNNDVVATGDHDVRSAMQMGVHVMIHAIHTPVLTILRVLRSRLLPGQARVIGCVI
jgi:hypothetical protein